MGKTAANKSLSAKQRADTLAALQQRFEKNVARHKDLRWEAVRAKIEANPDKLWSLSEMERSGGEPDVVAQDKRTGELHFFDCSLESPAGRRSLCYDEAALKARKENKPKGSALALAAAMGVELLDEGQYRFLQSFGPFDAKTSSWLLTPDPIRKLGGAIFGDYRYANVFIYHNGAESYYAARGFRTLLRV